MSNLCLGFRKNRPLFEEVVIVTPSGEEIKVRFSGVVNGKVRIIFDAEDDVKIYRRNIDGKTNKEEDQ